MTLRTYRSVLTILSLLLCAGEARAELIVLYDQDFESPANFANNGGDVNIFTSVNQNYGGQPAGFEFAQAFTVETINVSGSRRGAGTAAFGTGYSDPAGAAGDFVIGLLSTLENDLLGLSFNVGEFSFLNVSVDVTSLDLSTFNGPFVPPGPAGIPTFQFTLFDNPGGTTNTGTGTILDRTTVTATESARTVIDFTTAVLALSTEGNTNGNVILQIDLLTGGYAAFDNLLITASDIPGNVPEPDTLLLLAFGFSGLLLRRAGRAQAVPED